MAAATSRLPEFLQRRPFAGAPARANVEGRPPEVVIFLKLHGGRIAEAGFQASGYGYLIACCSALLELAVGQSPLTARS